MQLTNAITQLLIFYVLLFAPVLIPKEQLPEALQALAVIFPTTYAADAIRATVTDLPGTHLARSLLLLAGFAVLSLAASSIVVRRRA
jgi:ABC-2 type transport system permease protein